MSDELKRLYADEWKAAHPHPSKQDVDASERFLQALQALESQNQALQERIEEVAGYAVQLRPLSHEQALILPKLLLQLLSPTQETDPE